MCRLLIVDDERVILDSLYGYLSEQFDFEIYRAESARQALDVLRRMSVDLVISDISMPRMDGLELLGIIAGTWPACRVMLLTAYNDFNYAYQAMRHPHVRYLLKIESYEEIRRNVQEMANEIEEERRSNQLMLTMDRRLHQTAYAVCNYVTGRLVAQGVPLPLQQELDALQIPLRLSRPVLLALGQFEITAEEARGGVFEEITRHLEKSLLPLEMTALLSYGGGSQAFWLIQSQGERDASALVTARVQVEDILGRVPGRVREMTGCAMAMVLALDFVPFDAVHGLYRRCRLCIERMHDETGLVLMQEAAKGETDAGDFPDVEELRLLWELIGAGRWEELAALLEERLAFLRGIPLLRCALPLPAVAALNFLILKAACVYAPDGAHDGDARRLAAAEQGTGAQWLSEALALLRQIMERRAGVQARQSAWVVRTVDEYIEKHFGEDLTLTDLAAQVSYNPSYLSRCYKEYTGQNVMAHLSEVRIAEARRMLTETGRRIGDIAMACGFCSTRYFNIAFKKSLGMTPIAYRQSKG